MNELSYDLQATSVGFLESTPTVSATAPPRLCPGCWLPLWPSINSSLIVAFADTVPWREEDWCVHSTGAGLCGE